MGIVCTLAGDMCRFSYGNYNPWTVPFVPDQSIALRCGQNDRAAFQLVFYHDEDMMLTFETAPALHKVWPVPAYRISCAIPDAADCKISMSFVEDVRDDDGNYKGEILLSAPRKYQEKLRAGQVWIELEAGENLSPGLYEGSVQVWECRLFGEEQQVYCLPFSLKVLPVRLPALIDGDFNLDLWQHHTCLARTYEVPLWGEEHFGLMERYLEALVQLGQKSITLIVSEAPWSGQWSAWYRTNPSDVFEYNMVRVTKDRNGVFQYDFSAMDRYIRLCMAHGVGKEIEIFGLAGVWTLPDAGLSGTLEDGEDAVRIRYFDEESGCMRYFRKQKELDAYLRAIDRELSENGWAHLARVACDEPADRNAFQKMLNRLKGLMPHVRFKVMVCSAELLEGEYEQVSDCVVNLPLILGNQELTERLRGRYHLSYYTAVEPPHPNTFLCCHPAEIRFLPWLSVLLEMDGFLRWAAWLWPDRPFDWDSYHFQKFRAGGMQLVYPGKNQRPLYSLRYKQLQRGIRDYLILKEYERRTGQKGAARQAAQRLLKVPAEALGDCRRAEEFLCLEQGSFDSVTDALLESLAAEGGM